VAAATDTPQAIHAVAAELPRLEKNRAKAEWPYEVGLIPIVDLVIDDTYQRPPHRAFIVEMAENFDESLVGTIDVSRRKPNLFAVLDGQQRVEAMRLVGKTAAFASIYDGMSIQDEAAFFYRKNKDRRAMKHFFAFRARIVAGDPVAIKINEIVEMQGFSLGPSSNERDTIGATTSIENAYMYGSNWRDESLTPTLVTIREAWLGRNGSLDGVLIGGLSRFWQHFSDEEVDMATVVETLQSFGGPKNLIGLAREKQAVSSAISRGMSIQAVTARVLAENYNKKMRAGRRGASFEGKLEIERLGMGV